MCTITISSIITAVTTVVATAVTTVVVAAVVAAAIAAVVAAAITAVVAAAFTANFAEILATTHSSASDQSDRDYSGGTEGAGAGSPDEHRSSRVAHIHER